MGTKSEPLEVVPDTGSSNLWVYSSECNSAVCNLHNTYDGSTSDDHSVTTEEFKISYGSGSVNGYVASDYVSLDDDIYAEDFKYGEIYTVKGITFYFSTMSGILGLAYDSISVNNLPTFITASNLSPKTFSMCLKDTNEDSYMTIPGLFPDTVESDYNFHPVVEKKYYSV